MARVTYVKSARKSGRRCFKCGTEIEKGDSYKWFANRIGRMSTRKDVCSTCAIRGSDMTTSPHLSALYAAQEQFEDNIGDGNDETTIESLLTEFAEAVREVAEGYRESASNIEDGFGHATYQSEELNERADDLDAFADDVESASGEIEEFDEETVRDEVIDELETPDGGEADPTEIEDAIAERRMAHWQEQQDKAQDAVSNLP